MARKGKIGIDYFSHDVDILQDKKIKLIKAKHGLIGYAIYLRLLEEIYRDTGYYLQLDENFNILFSDDNKIDFDVYILILNDCINIGLFNSKLYEKYKVITSKRIQLNYFSGTERRKEVEFIKEYLLSDPTLNYNTERVNVSIITLNVDINPINDDICAQSKGKESKREEKKPKENLIKHLTKKIKENNLEEYTDKLIEFMEYRKTIKKPLKSKQGITGFVNIAKKLNDMSFDIGKCFDYSMEKEWQSPPLDYFEKNPDNFKKERKVIELCMDKKLYENSDYQAGGLWQSLDVTYVNFKPAFISDEDKERVEQNNAEFIEKYCRSEY